MPRVGTFENAQATWKIYPLGNDAGEPVGAGDILVSELGKMPSPHSTPGSPPTSAFRPTTTTMRSSRCSSKAAPPSALAASAR